MPPDQRAKRDKWHADRKVGSAAARQARRLNRQQAREAREMLARPPLPPSPEVIELQAEADEIRRQLAALKQDPDQTPIGVFA